MRTSIGDIPLEIAQGELETRNIGLGDMAMQHADGTQETVRAGDVYDWPAAHTASTDEGAVFIEVGPERPMRQFGDHAKGVLG